MCKAQDKPTDGHWQIVRDNLGLVRKALAQCGVPQRLWEELTSDIGYEALLEAARNHDPSKGAFTTYAMGFLLPRIRGWLADENERQDAERIYASLGERAEDMRGAASDRDFVGVMLTALPTTHRQAVRLSYESHQTCRQIAKAMGISKSRVAQLLAEARKAMEEMAVE